MPELKLPDGMDWREWVRRWDRMQESYLVDRAERFALMARMVSGTQPPAARILDLGCGPASLSQVLIDSLPQSQLVAIDVNPTLLALAKARLEGYGGRVRLELADLRQSNWINGLAAPFDAVVSATALHWLSENDLAALYQQIAHVLRIGGIFLNADHVASDYARIQETWVRHRDEVLARTKEAGADDWNSFWASFRVALGQETTNADLDSELGERGVEEGLPLPWHFHKLKSSGFRYVDCFWRSDCDAIYGGIL